MARHRPIPPRARPRGLSGAYELIVRGLDGRPRVERFDDAAAYRDRLAALETSNVQSVSVDDIIGWLDTPQP